MVSALDSEASAPGSSPSRRHYVVFLSKTLYSQGRSELHSIEDGVSSGLIGNLARMQTYF